MKPLESRTVTLDELGYAWMLFEYFKENHTSLYEYIVRKFERYTRKQSESTL